MCVSFLVFVLLFLLFFGVFDVYLCVFVYVFVFLCVQCDMCVRMMCDVYRHGVFMHAHGCTRCTTHTTQVFTWGSMCVYNRATKVSRCAHVLGNGCLVYVCLVRMYGAVCMCI